jgi:hypothetical protein
MYGTPHSPVLHIVERYRLLGYEAAKEDADNPHEYYTGKDSAVPTANKSEF